MRTDKAIKDQAEEIFNELGLNMTTAINIFLRTAIREHGIPFELKLEVPNDTTAAAIEEGRKMMKDPSAPRYSSMDALKAAVLRNIFIAVVIFRPSSLKIFSARSLIALSVRIFKLVLPHKQLL